jgi:hypothetical protein
MDRRRIKWSYATHRITGLPRFGPALEGRIQWSDIPPRPNDVIVAEVGTISRHRRLELTDKRRSKLFPGDLVGMAFGRRYATRQYEGALPGSLSICHMLAVGGVCGEVIGMAANMTPPTTLDPLGYVLDEHGRRINTEDHGLRPVAPPTKRPVIILAVGSAMDSGKTTAAFSVVHGLTRAGCVVSAAKLTGTASVKDLQLMEDAGAEEVLDFTDVGYASTAMCSPLQLENLLASIVSNLCLRDPDYIVLEVADGVVQRETQMLLQMLGDKGCVDHVIYACHDSLGVVSGIDHIRGAGLKVAGVSGWVACGPLAAQEAQDRTNVPVLRPEELQDPGIIDLFVDEPDQSFWRDRWFSNGLPVQVYTQPRETGT